MTIQIALKLPENTVRQIDALVTAGQYENRTQAVRAGVDAVIEQARRRSIDESFRRGYTEMPEDEDEIAEAVQSGIALIGEEPWEKWW